MLKILKRNRQIFLYLIYSFSEHAFALQKSLQKIIPKISVNKQILTASPSINHGDITSVSLNQYLFQRAPSIS